VLNFPSRLLRDSLLYKKDRLFCAVRQYPTIVCGADSAMNRRGPHRRCPLPRVAPRTARLAGRAALRGARRPASYLAADTLIQAGEAVTLSVSRFLPTRSRT
jgi:hypothetical protein